MATTLALLSCLIFGWSTGIQTVLATPNAIEVVIPPYVANTYNLVPDNFAGISFEFNVLDHLSSSFLLLPLE